MAKLSWKRMIVDFHANWHKSRLEIKAFDVRICTHVATLTGIWHVERTCTEPATFKWTRQRARRFFDTICPAAYRHSSFNRSFTRNILFFFYVTRAKMWSYETRLLRDQPGSARGYGTGVPTLFPIGKPVTIFHCPTRQCICLFHPFSIYPLQKSLLDPSWPSIEKVYRHSLQTTCTLIPAWAHFVDRDNVFIIHWIIRHVAGNQVGRYYATPSATSKLDLLARL